MHVLLFPVLLSSLFVLQSTSFPLIEPQSNDLVQLHSTELDSGHMVTHFRVSDDGIARRSAGKDPHPYGPKNCVTPPAPDCNHFTNAATADACDQLSIWLGGCSSVRDDCGGTGMNASTKAIDQTNRNICHGGCCIYWTKNVPGLKYQDLRDKVDNCEQSPSLIPSPLPSPASSKFGGLFTNLKFSKRCLLLGWLREW